MAKLDLKVAMERGKLKVQYDSGSGAFEFWPEIQIDFATLFQHASADDYVFLNRLTEESLKKNMLRISYMVLLQVDLFVDRHSHEHQTLPFKPIVMGGVPQLLGRKHAFALRHQLWQEIRLLRGLLDSPWELVGSESPPLLNVLRLRRLPQAVFLRRFLLQWRRAAARLKSRVWFLDEFGRAC